MQSFTADFLATWTIVQECPADLDGDGEVSGSDLSMLLGAWGGGDADLDLDGDEFIDGSDLAFLLGDWGACP